MRLKAFQIRIHLVSDKDLRLIGSGPASGKKNAG